jgi:beta-mannosidase
MANAQSADRRRILLNEGWYVKQIETDKPVIGDLIKGLGDPDDSWMKATMPAQVHDVLLAHGLIADPHIGENASACAWVGEKDWAYICRFPTPAGITGPAILRFGGLDTLADAYLNGASIGHFENMFREYAVDVKDHLAPSGEENVLVVHHRCSGRQAPGI